MAQHADIKGLPLIMGGEIRAISKLAGRSESAVVLIRGAAGSGKTIFAAQLAAHEALVRSGDVVYCCIELLPSELDAQVSGLTFGVEQRTLRVSNLPEGPPISADLAPRIFASIIDIPDGSEPDFGGELQRSIGEARGQGLSPKVVVIDSLTDGYRLGALVPRYLADGLAKFAAEEGILLILLEEVVEQRDSTWTFVADVVLELAHHGAAGTSAAEERAITVRKNRFGPAQVGPHAFAIHRAGGIEIYPRLGAYLSETARATLPQGLGKKTTPVWNVIGATGHHVGLPKRGEVILITGADATVVSVALDRCIARQSILRLDMASTEHSDQMLLPCGDPVLGPERMLSQCWTRLEEVFETISGLAIGDLAAIQYNIDPDGLRRALSVIIMIARTSGLPIALFETASEVSPLSSHLADTIIRVYSKPSASGSPQVDGLLNSRRRKLIDVHVSFS